MIQWAQVAKTLQDWVVDESGLTDSTVIWQEREGGRPAGRYISLRVSSALEIGHAWTQYKPAVAPTPGAELDTLRQGFREVVLTLVCYAAKADAVITAVATLDKAISARFKWKNALKAVGVAVLSTERIQSVDGQIGASFEARAIATVRLSLASNVVGFETYIESLALRATVAGEEDPIVDEIVGNFPTELPAPTTLAAVAGDAQVALTWATDGSAESFSLYFATASPVDVGTATEIPAVTSPYVHTGRVNGTEYFYGVTGHNDRLGESALSNETSATPTEPTEP